MRVHLYRTHDNKGNPLEEMRGAIGELAGQVEDGGAVRAVDDDGTTIIATSTIRSVRFLPAADPDWCELETLSGSRWRIRVLAEQLDVQAAVEQRASLA